MFVFLSLSISSAIIVWSVLIVFILLWYSYWNAGSLLIFAGVILLSWSSTALLKNILLSDVGALFSICLNWDCLNQIYTSQNWYQNSHHQVSIISFMITQSYQFSLAHTATCLVFRLSHNSGCHSILKWARFFFLLFSNIRGFFIFTYQRYSLTYVSLQSLKFLTISSIVRYFSLTTFFLAYSSNFRANLSCASSTVEDSAIIFLRSFFVILEYLTSWWTRLNVPKSHCLYLSKNLLSLSEIYDKLQFLYQYKFCKVAPQVQGHFKK